MGRLTSNINFRAMTLTFMIRNLLMPPKSILEEARLEPGFKVLDFGCGPGNYSLAAAELVGKSGKVYALDINPLALQRVSKVASKRGLSNIEVIQSDCPTGLEDSSIDVVLLYDTFHILSDPEVVLKELNRILKPDSLLSFSDHHLKEENILSGVREGSFFKLLKKGRKTYSFSAVKKA